MKKGSQTNVPTNAGNNDINDTKNEQQNHRLSVTLNQTMTANNHPRIGGSKYDKSIEITYELDTIYDDTSLRFDDNNPNIVMSPKHRLSPKNSNTLSPKVGLSPKTAALSPKMYGNVFNKRRNTDPTIITPAVWQTEQKYNDLNIINDNNINIVFNNSVNTSNNGDNNESKHQITVNSLDDFENMIKNIKSKGVSNGVRVVFDKNNNIKSDINTNNINTAGIHSSNMNNNGETTEVALAFNRNKSVTERPRNQSTTFTKSQVLKEKDVDTNYDFTMMTKKIDILDYIIVFTYLGLLWFLIFLWFKLYIELKNPYLFNPNIMVCLLYYIKNL